MVREAENRLLDYRTQLLVWHDDVKEKTEEKAKLAQQQLPKETRNQLKEKGYDDQIINDYILLRVTLNEVRKNTNFDENQVAQFESSVNELSTLDVILKRLDNACNIPDTSLSSFSSKNVAQTRTELFNDDPWIWNESLKTARDNNMDLKSHKEAYDKIFPEIWEDKVISKYWNLLQWELKTFWQQYEINRDTIKNQINNIMFRMVKNQIHQFDENWKNYVSDEEKKLLENYNKMRLAILWTEAEKFKDWIQYKLESQTKKLMEEMCIISQIKWMYMCIWQEKWKDFTLNKSNEITNENWVLTLQWHIDWVNFSVSHDTAKTNQHLKVHSKLGLSSENNNTFVIWWEKNYVDSPFILPSQEEIFGVITKVIQSDSNDLSRSDNLSKYLENLQNSIVWTMEWVYKDASFAHHYITNQVKWEKIVDNTLGLIGKINLNIVNDKDLMKHISQETNKDLFDFLKILQFNIENSTDTEKDNLIKCITEILRITENYKKNQSTEIKHPSIIEDHLKNQTWKDWDENSKLKLVFELFKKYDEYSSEERSSERSDQSQTINNKLTSSKFIINDLYRDLFESNNWKILSQTAWKYKEAKMIEEINEITDAEHESADDGLKALENEEDFPSSPEVPVDTA